LFALWFIDVPLFGTQTIPSRPVVTTTPAAAAAAVKPKVASALQRFENMREEDPEFLKALLDVTRIMLRKEESPNYPVCLFTVIDTDRWNWNFLCSQARKEGR